MIRIAVLGVGRIGRMHAGSGHARPGTPPAGVRDVTDTTAQDVSQAVDDEVALA